MGRSDWFGFYRLALVAMFTLTLFACSGGGGCSGCAGCGIEPIPGGYPLDQRIDNSAQVRLTSSGIGFIENNIDEIVTNFLPGGLDFPIDEQNVDAGPITITVCEGGGCQAHIEIDSLELSPTDPNQLNAHIRLILDSRDSAGMRSEWPGTCDLDLDTRRGGRPFVGLDAVIRFAGIPNDDPVRIARRGYTEIIVESIALDSGEGIENDDIDISGGFLGSCGILDLGLIKGFIIGLVEDQLDGVIDGALGDQLCTQRGDYGCPNGSQAVPDEDPGSICRYGPSDTDECVSILLGTDGRGDLGGAFIGGFSPGTHAYAQFLLASGGDGEAINDGMSLFFYGGFMGTDPTFTDTPAHNSCVPVTEPPPLPTIERTDAFRGNVIPGTTTETHVGIGIAEPYLDYAGWGLFDSGALCIGAGTRLSQQLSTGLVSAAIMSLPELTFPLDNAALTISVRPQTAPDFTIGSGGDTDPFLQIDLREVQIDFYVWSTERYIRFMTFQTDLNIGINLSVADNQLVPEIVGINASNSVVTNSDLLEERPEALAGVLEGLVSSLAGMLGSSLSPFDLPDIMGFALEVPDGGITPVTAMEDGTRYLGIFANLALASTSMPIVADVDTRLAVSDLRLDHESMTPETWQQGEPNTVWLHFEADGPAVALYEYSYRIDGGPWSRWTEEPRIQIDDDVLLLQARHEIEARARIVGEPSTADATPARAELLVDILPPTVTLARTVEGVEVDAHDVITPEEALEYRYRIDGQWTEWSREASAELTVEASDVLVEVRDESGNVGRSQAPLIRGLPNPETGGGCGCRVVGEDGPSAPIGLLALLGMLGGIFWRRRKEGRATKRAATFLSLLGLVLLLASGCECGDSIPCQGACTAASPPAVTAGQICCEATDMCEAYDTDALCDPGYFCPVDNVLVDEACDVTCSECTVKPDLVPGVLATHLDAVVDESSNVHLSGYSPGRGASGPRYGDLVFGTWSETGVSWEIVDGAPDSPITNNPDGWRGGVSAPGPDVGRWTSIVESAGSFMISYYDQSNRALKVAAGGPGAWQIHTVDDAGDSGRYSSMILTSAGVPVIAYLRMAESTDTPGVVNGSVMVAMANMANPSGAADWTITEVASAQMPCRDAFCESGTCIESGMCVTPTSDCAAECASGSVCVMGSCEVAIGAGYVEDMPPAYGLYTSLAETPSGLGVVFYDRTAGNVYGVSYDGMAWGTPFLIDGYAVGDPNIGDSGQGADLFVDDTGNWHVVYIDGAEETLRYALVDPSGTVTSTEIVDDGSTSDGMTRFEDGRHIVGDDASVIVDAMGTVRVVYQDATSQHAVVAVRGSGGGWAISRFDTEGSTGYWLEQELSGTTSYVALFWRARDGRNLDNGVRVFALN